MKSDAMRWCSRLLLCAANNASCSICRAGRHNSQRYTSRDRHAMQAVSTSAHGCSCGCGGDVKNTSTQYHASGGGDSRLKRLPHVASPPSNLRVKWSHKSARSMGPLAVSIIIRFTAATSSPATNLRAHYRLSSRGSWDALPP